MTQPGYFRFPTIHGDTVVFVSEDDLWRVAVTGGRAERLTSGLSALSHPRFSPDGRLIAVSASEEGVREVYVMAAEGGPLRRLTWFGGLTRVVGWTPEGEVVFFTDERSRMPRLGELWVVSPEGGQPRRLPWGIGQGLSFGPVRPNGRAPAVLCRHQDDLARWKRYRGGRRGTLWVDAEGSGQFEERVRLDGNVASPLWIGDRIWFVSDHEYDGNLWSVPAAPGEAAAGLVRHTAHEGFTVRWPDSDGQTVVYAVGGDLWALDAPLDAAAPRRIDIAYHSPRTQLQRRFVPAHRYVQDRDLHPDGHSLGLIVRGKPFVFGAWEGAVRQLGAPQGVRHRLLRWMHDGERVVVVSDAGGEEAIEVYRVDTGAVRRLDGLDIGRPLEVEVDPSRPRLAMTNHRHELAIVDLQEGELVVLDRSPTGRISAPSWSRDGRWLAWARPEDAGSETSRIRLHDTTSGKTWDVTDGRYLDVCPSFDPDGKHLYFLSRREFDPVYDNIYFDLNFPRGMRPYLVTLRADLPNPFVPEPRALKKPPAPTAAPKDPVVIDTDGLSERLLPFPVAEGRYDEILALPGGKVLLVRAPVSGALDRKWFDPGAPKAENTLLLWDPDTHELHTLTNRMTSIRLDRARQTALITSGWRVRVTVAAPDKGQREELKRTEDDKAGRKTGWVHVDRARVAVEPRPEWRQILREAWRLMRDHFWSEDMSGVDWEQVHARYAPLVDRVGTRGELSDVLWEMQGELGTSHAYEMGGDARAAARYPIGRLGAEFSWDGEREGWRVDHLVRGEPGDLKRRSPLLAPGLGVSVGSVILAVGGQPLGPEDPPEAHLANASDTLVELTLHEEDDDPRVITVHTLATDAPARYRDWVLANRATVHARTGGRVGYVHIPDMSPVGYAEFHRDYLTESRRDGLIVDVRWNGGGHVSQLLLEKLARRRVGYQVGRWTGPSPYPRHSVQGPMVALTNEGAGSDGDVFSHVWKLLGLGPLIGTRTWGGTIGISPRHSFVDRGVTTQPEFSFWFQDVRWGLENQGTDPDIEVAYRPQDWAAGVDPQLDRGIAEILTSLPTSPQAPAFDGRPFLGRPERS